MASLTTILRNKSTTFNLPESNLVQGQVYFQTVGGTSGSFAPGKALSWQAPGNGTVVVEIWGASGSGGKMCCCGWGIPGNPGAYSKKTFAVNNGDTITGSIGQSCINNLITYKGISEPTCICYTTSSGAGAGTMCAGGGRGGVSLCCGSYCCFVGQGYPGFTFESQCLSYQGSGAGCGIICNWVTGEIATATGGDLNLDGGWSCAIFLHCNTCCMCYHTQLVRISPGLFSQCGNVVTVQMECGEGYSQPSGNGRHQLIASLNALNRNPSTGFPFASCWNGFRACGCYENTLCQNLLPHGVPGLMGSACSGVRDYGIRGGNGAVRIKFIEE